MTPAEVTKVLALMEERLAAAQRELQDRPARPFYLVAGHNDMVVVEAEGGIFRLDAASPDKGYGFVSYSRAKLAANKWNANLDAAQKAARCTVHAVSRAQYLEYIVENLTNLRPNMEALLARLQEQAEK